MLGIFITFAVVSLHCSFKAICCMSDSKSYNTPIGPDSKSAYFEHLFQSVPAGVVLLDREDCVIDFNQWFTDLFSYNIEEARGKKINDLIVPEHLKEEGEKATKDVAEGQPISFETVRQTKHGKLLNVSISGQPITIQYGEIAVIAVYQDITDRNRTEEALRESEQKLRTIFHTANIGFTIVDVTGQVMLHNAWYAEFLGYDPKETMGLTIREITHPDDYQESIDKFNQLIERKTDKYRLEKRFIRKDGQIAWGDVSVSSIKDSEGMVRMVIGMINDITERKRAEASLKKSEERLRELNATKDTFISILSHDLRSPFTAILGFAELLLDSIDYADKEDIRDQVGVIHTHSSKTLTLLNDILAWAMAQSGKMTVSPTAINFPTTSRAVAESLFNQAKKKNIHIECKQGADFEVFADENMLQTILRNLISNAVKFTPPGGRIVISSTTDNEFATITVSDNGIGIDKNDIPRLWDLSSPLSTEGTAGETGTGYGLLLCKELVEKQGGKIWAESSPGKGSDFIFTLPLNPSSVLPT